MKNKLSKKQNKKDPTAWSVMCGVFDFLVFLFENCRSKLAMKINPLLHEVETIAGPRYNFIPYIENGITGIGDTLPHPLRTKYVLRALRKKD